jgi:hypothetical protein
MEQCLTQKTMHLLSLGMRRELARVMFLTPRRLGGRKRLFHLTYMGSHLLERLCESRYAGNIVVTAEIDP